MCRGCPILVTSTVKKLNVQALSEILIHHKIILDMYCKYMLLKKDKIIHSLSLPYNCNHKPLFGLPFT